MTISYGSDLSAEIGSDYSAKVSASVSSSYSTILQSPKVYDKGNMANDEVNIEFEYVDPWTEDDPWYSYNKILSYGHKTNGTTAGIKIAGGFLSFRKGKGGRLLVFGRSPPFCLWFDRRA